MRKYLLMRSMLSIFVMLFLTNCGGHVTPNDFGRDIANHPAFEGFGELLLTRDNNSSSYDVTLSNVSALMTYPGNVHPDVVVEALNHMIDEVRHGGLRRASNEQHPLPNISRVHLHDATGQARLGFLAGMSAEDSEIGKRQL